METVGSFEAKTHLAQLLERVAQGEEITITRHGKPVARLVPPDSSVAATDPRATIEAIKAFRKGRALGNRSPHDLIEEGRRF